MVVSQKCRYALRAVLELSRRYGQGPISTSEIAEAQEIPTRFLEAILNQLARGGIIVSRRGSQGGYALVMEPDRLTVGAVIRLVQGAVAVASVRGPAGEPGPKGERAFMGMWERVAQAISEIYDSTTFRDILEEEARLAESAYAPSYAI